MQYITKKELQEMILKSCENVERDKEKINKINVFPVPDQDTGGNLAKTLGGIKKSIEGKEFKDLDELSQAILDGALTAAQGNAGVIYTGFLTGFLPAFKNHNPIDGKKLAEAMQEGAKTARQAIQSPKEGTILDVIEATADSLKEESREESDIVNLFKKAIEKAEEALKATTEKMEVFKKANVVDAGGFGFLIILQSYLEALEGPVFAQATETEERKEDQKKRKFIQTLSYRFEIVALIKKPKISQDKLRQKLEKLGNSLEIVSVGERMKLHIHTDFPDEVKNIVRSAGTIESLREEDMSREVVGEESIKKVSIGIVTDEVADLTPKIIDHYKIEVVPFKVDWPEGKDLPGDNIYQKMREADKRGITKLPKTSQAPPKVFQEAYKKQFENGFEKIICITLSSKLSGGYNSALQAKQTLPEEQRDNVFVFDSYNATCGEGLLVLRAIELVQEQREAYEILQELKDIAPKVYIYAFLADPKWLEWGGRLSRSQANWVRRLQKIGVRPLIGLKDGVVEQIGFRFGSKDTPEAIFQEIEKNSRKARKEGKKIRVVITHCDNFKEAKKLKERLKEIKAEVSFINLTSSVVGVHVGPGALVAGWMAI